MRHGYFCLKSNLIGENYVNIAVTLEESEQKMVEKLLVRAEVGLG